MAMRVVLLIALSILSLASPVSANSSEAGLLVQAVDDVNISAQAVVDGSSSVEDQVAASALILHDIGPVDGYTDACRPLARYVLLLATSWHDLLAGIVAGDQPAVQGHMVVATALSVYWDDSGGFIPVITTDCLNGI